MADEPDGGTPKDGTDPKPGGGTPGDGTERGGEPDAALQLAWKKKAEEGNRAIEELKAAQRREAELRARLDRIEAGTQAQDPRIAHVQDLQLRAAAGDAEAAFQLEVATMQARSLAEAQLSQSLMIHGVPKEHMLAVAEQVRRSNYAMSVQDALAMVVPPSVAEANDAKRRLEEENERLKSRVAELEKAPRAPGWSGAAPGSNPQGRTMPHSEYMALLREGGAKAAEVQAQVQSNAITLVRG